MSTVSKKLCRAERLKSKEAIGRQIYYAIAFSKELFAMGV
jgi:hypothetical protein